MWRETTGTSPSPVHRSALSYATRATSLRFTGWVLRFFTPFIRFSSRSVIPRLRSSSRHSVRPAKRRLRRVRSVERRREEAAGRGRTTDDQGSGSFIVLHSSLYTYAAQPGGRGPDRQGPRSGPGPSRLRRVLVTELKEDTSSEVNRVCLSSFPLTLLPALFPFTRLRLTHSHPIRSVSVGEG